MNFFVRFCPIWSLSVPMGPFLSILRLHIPHQYFNSNQLWILLSYHIWQHFPYSIRTISCISSVSISIFRMLCMDWRVWFLYWYRTSPVESRFRSKERNFWPEKFYLKLNWTMKSKNGEKRWLKTFKRPKKTMKIWIIHWDKGYPLTQTQMIQMTRF